MTRMAPLAMATGIALELFAAGETRRGVNRHDWQEGRSRSERCGRIKAETED